MGKRWDFGKNKRGTIFKIKYSHIKRKKIEKKNEENGFIGEVLRFWQSGVSSSLGRSKEK